MNERVTIHVSSRDRHSELALLLLSLKYQTYQYFDILILDDASGTPIGNAHFLNCIINQLKLEGHCIDTIRNNNSFGVCYARNLLLEKDEFNNPYICRLDDDVYLSPDYLERLINVINRGYDIASGVTPTQLNPAIKRSTKFIKPIINEIKFDTEGNITKFGDDCGYMYIEDEVISAHHFRSCALYKKDIDIKYERGLSKIGFREESFFSLRALWKGYKIGVDTQAIAYHLRTPSGGCRANDYAQLIAGDDFIFSKWVKRQFKTKGNPLEAK